MIQIVKVGCLLLATLREIFDEAAYQRFLTRSQLQTSPDAYAAFWRERQSDPVRPSKCC